jgi:hypothetical protein
VREKNNKPGGVPGEIFKLGGEAMTSDLARLHEITLNNFIIPRDWKITTLVPIYKGAYRSAP